MFPSNRTASHPRAQGYYLCLLGAGYFIEMALLPFVAWSALRRDTAFLLAPQDITGRMEGMLAWDLGGQRRVEGGEVDCDDIVLREAAMKKGTFSVYKGSWHGAPVAVKKVQVGAARPPDRTPSCPHARPHALLHARTPSRPPARPPVGLVRPRRRARLSPSHDPTRRARVRPLSARLPFGARRSRRRTGRPSATWCSSWSRRSRSCARCATRTSSTS